MRAWMQFVCTGAQIQRSMQWNKLKNLTEWASLIKKKPRLTNLKTCSVLQIFIFQKIFPPGKLSHNSISSHHSPLRSWLQDPHIRALDRISRPSLRGVRTEQPCSSARCNLAQNLRKMTPPPRREDRKTRSRYDNKWLVQWPEGREKSRWSNGATVEWKKNDEKHTLMWLEIFKIKLF